MRKLKRAAKRGVIGPVGQSAQRWRARLVSITPPGLRGRVDRMIDYLDMIFIDHGIFRVVYPNRFRIADGVWRSSQPWPHQVKYCAKKGIRTIVNLRGERDCGSYRLEVDACRKYDIELVEYKLRSRAPPQPEAIKNFQAFFKDLEYPILLHCKSGADRVGFASALHLHLINQAPLEEAQGQLHAKFGHFRQADTGILDYFFERYAEYAKANPMSFLEWADSVYDPAELKQSFRAGYWSSVLVDKVLRRE